MNIEEYRTYCLSKNGVTEEFPFDADTLAFKVGGKIFALTNVEQFDFINLKCDPEIAIELREQKQGVQPGYHMNKKHWNSVYLDSDVSDAVLKELIDHSYEQIIDSLPKKIREQLQ